MNKKRIKKVSSRILMALLAVAMVFTFAASTIGTTVAADTAVFKKNDSIYTDYTSYLDSSVVQALPATVSDDETISVIVKLDTPTLLEAYNETDKAMSFSEYVTTDEAQKIKAQIQAEKERYLAALTRSGVSYTTGCDYANIIAGFEVLYKAKSFETACEQLSGGAIAIVGEVYNVSETQLVENKIDVVEETGIFDSSDFKINGKKYSGSGMVVAVLDTGLDYTHSAFDPARLDKSNLSLTKSKVAAHIANTTAASRVSGLTADDVYINEKVPFAFDYADNDSDVYSLHNNHGTHVSGVIVGNDDTILGVAPDAQLVSMKIFSDVQDSARASWILAALEDCVELGVDVINMSLGTACGFSRETDQEQMSGVYDDIRALGISLVVAASNSFNSAYGSEKNGNLGLTSNPDTSTVGSPSTYDGALSVASINGTKTPYMLDSDGTIIYFVESSDSAGEEKNFFDGLLGSSQDPLELEYVLIPGVGNPSDYDGIDVKGKIALVRRGTNTFEEKAKAAEAAGAKALIVYNNTSGDIRMNVGIVDIPVCSVSQDDGERLAAAKTGTLKISRSQTSGPFMSDFSSWGPSPSLQIKPEITAHGGNILSAVTGHGYERLSGTSMACPNMAGVIALLRQYVITNFESKIMNENGVIDYVEVNSIVNRLLMSTADIVNNKNGLPYAVRKQGAGLANLDAAATTKAYILTYDRLDGSVMDKSKIELGDDPSKSGVYVLKFTIDNFGTTALSYDISASVMTEGVSETPTYQGETVVSEEGYLLKGASVVITSTRGGSLSGNTVTVAAGAQCDVVITITLSDADKAYLDSSFENGMYVEGFVTLTAKDADSVDLNVPYLAFYGNWYQAPLFDLDYFETNADELNDALDTLDKTLPDAYATRPIGGISEDYVSYLGSYYFLQNPNNKVISASRDYIALSNTEGTIHSLRFVWAGMLRNADKIVITITDDATGEVILEKVDTSIRKSYGDGGSYIYPANVEIEFDTLDYNLKNNSTYTVKLQGYLDYDDGTGTNKTPEYNLNSTFEFPLTIDFEAPTLTDCEFYTEYDKDAKKNRLFVRMAVYDNHFAMGMQVGYVGYQYDDTGAYVTDESGSKINMLYPFESYMTPIYSERNGITYVTYELTDYIYDIKSNERDGDDTTFAVSIYDYALNEATYEIKLPDSFAELYLKESSITLNPNEVYTIDANVYPETEWAELLEYSTSSSAIRIVNNKIVAVKSGKAEVEIYDKKSGKSVWLAVTVRAPGDEGYKEVSKPVADVFELTGYTTLKAFYFMSSDDRDIGETGDEVIFNGQSYSLSFYPSESVRIKYKLDAYFPDDTTVEFISSNESIAKVSQDGTIVALGEGYTSITVRVLQNGKATYTTATISIEVKDPYVRTGPSLDNYYGAGEMNSGIVEIPEDMLFTKIGQFAFSNYEYVSKDLTAGDVIDDEEPDATKITYIGNDAIKKIIIPEGVESIGAYAFANLTALEEVVLPSTLESIEYGAFYNCTKLKTVKGLEHVKLINQNAFAYCNISNNLSLDSIHAIGDYAFFENRSLKSVTFPSTLSSIGAYAFAFNTYTEEQLEEYGIKSPSLVNFDVSACGTVKYGPYVFMNCTSLKSVTMNTNVIPAGAFYNCAKLTNVNIGATVSSIGEYAFTGTAVSTFNVAEGNTAFKPSGSKSYLLSSDGSTLLLAAPGVSGSFSLTGVSRIGYGAFAGNGNITSVYMPDVTSVDGYAFSECTKLTSVTLGALTELGSYSFFLTSITELPNIDGVSYIGDYAFAFSLISKVEIGDGVTVGEGAFCECTELVSVVIGKNAVIGNSAFLRGMGTVDPRTGNYLNVELTHDLASGFYQYTSLSKLVSLEIRSNAVIGESAFMGAGNLRSVQLGEGASIGNMAFYNCRLLYDIDLSGVKKIGDMAFSGDNAYAFVNAAGTDYAVKDGNYVIVYYNPIFDKVDLSSLEELGSQAFMHCKRLTAVTLGDKLTAIPDMAFSNCDNLKYVNLENVVNIGYAAFSETDLVTADLSSALEIGDYAFTYCDKLDGVIFNPVCCYVGEGAFSYCSSLNNVRFLNKIGHISDYAFAYTDIREADLASATYVGDLAFIKEELTPFKLTLGENIETLGDNPFALCQIGPFYKVAEEVWNGITVGTEYLYTYDINDHVKIINGSIYCVVPNGLELTTYVGLDKDGNSLDKDNVKLDESTVRITAMAFVGSDITRVTLPHSLNSIGHKAFYQCGKLQIVVFESYEAPVLEEEFDQNLYDSYENIPSVGTYEFSYWEDQDGDGKLDTQIPVSYDGIGIVPYYMWNISSTKYNNVYYGANFVDHIGYVIDRDSEGNGNRNYANMGNLIMIAPSNGVYYDSFIINQYFGSRISGAVAADDVTMAAIAAINALPERVTLEDEHLVIAARAAYNKISSAEQQALVTEYLQKLITAENLIKAYKNAGSTDTPEVSDTPASTKDPTRTALIVLSVIETVEIVGVAAAAAIWFYLRRKKKMRENLALMGERRTVTVRKTAAETVKRELTAEEMAELAAAHEKRARELDAKHERNRKIKKIAVLGLLLALCIAGVAFAATKCSKDTSPYKGYSEAGYSFSVKYDANGGTFTTNTDTLIDTYNINDLPANEDGQKVASLLDPNSSARGNQAYLAAKVGYYLAGWYQVRTEIKDEDGNVTGYIYSGKCDFENAKLYIDPDKNYNPEKPVVTLYAAWVPSLTYEFYSVDGEGNTVLIGTKDMNPIGSSEITVPAYNPETGVVDINDFPYLQNNTYSEIYTDKECTEKITDATIAHTGSYDDSTATVANPTMKIYCKLLDGIHVRVDSADKLIANANLNGVYTLEGDLDFSGKRWPEVFSEGSFSGKIIGNGYSIKNVTLEQSNNSVTSFGLFGQISEGAVIKNVTFDNITVNVKAGSRLNANIGIIAGVLADGVMDSVKLKNSKMVVYTKQIASGTVIKPDYGLVCALGSVSGVDFSVNCGVEFSRFGDADTVEHVEYNDVTYDTEGRFKLTLKES